VPDQRAQLRRSRQQLLEVVEDQQQLALPQLCRELLKRRLRGVSAQPEPLENTRPNEPPIAHPCQQDDRRTTGKPARHTLRDRQSQARLAGAARVGVERKCPTLCVGMTKKERHVYDYEDQE
jgi:hypothetical protein